MQKNSTSGPLYIGGIADLFLENTITVAISKGHMRSSHVTLKDTCIWAHSQNAVAPPRSIEFKDKLLWNISKVIMEQWSSG